MVVKDVLRADETQPKRFVEPNGLRIGDLRSDSNSSWPPLVPNAVGGCEIDHVASDSSTLMPRLHPDEIDDQRVSSHPKQLEEADDRPVDLRDNHRIAALTGEKIPGPFGLDRAGGFKGDHWIEVKP